MGKLEIGKDKIINGRIIEGSFAEDLSITSVIIPEGVTDIGEIAFYGCANLREVVFPPGLRYIREEAFGESAIAEAMLPEGLELIEEKAFFSCESLRKAEVPGLSTVIGSDAFGCCDRLHEGFIACGYPGKTRHHEELQYTLLWCSCPDRHTAETSRRAEDFIHRYEELIMEWIINTLKRYSLENMTFSIDDEADSLVQDVLIRIGEQQLVSKIKELSKMEYFIE